MSDYSGTAERHTVWAEEVGQKNPWIEGRFYGNHWLCARSRSVSGKWHAEFTLPDGVLRENTFTFNVKGETLIGTVAGAQDETPIKEITGEMTSFTMERPFGTFNYKGTISGDENHEPSRLFD